MHKKKQTLILILSNFFYRATAYYVLENQLDLKHDESQEIRYKRPCAHNKKRYLLSLYYCMIHKEITNCLFSRSSGLTNSAKQNWSYIIQYTYKVILIENKLSFTTNNMISISHTLYLSFKVIVSSKPSLTNYHTYCQFPKQKFNKNPKIPTVWSQFQSI